MKREEIGESGASIGGNMAYVEQYLGEVHKLVDGIHKPEIEKMVSLLVNLRSAGGGAGNASHAVNDFRKICGIESYTPTDNVSEISARVNDDG